jgi:hypothetical protein
MYSEEGKILKRYLYNGINDFTESIEIPNKSRYINIIEKDYQCTVTNKGLIWSNEKRSFHFPFSSPLSFFPSELSR